jgi:hypothetical protein
MLFYRSYSIYTIFGGQITIVKNMLQSYVAYA